MEIVLNATLSGGVIMGAAADLITDPYRPMIAGWAIGCISALGFAYLSPFLKNKFGLHDSCGVLNLHGIPGIMGAIVAAVSTSNNAKDNYGD
jgi:ammonium transporter Rh